jgi:flagellar hook assembly protein FlgD
MVIGCGARVAGPVTPEVDAMRTLLLVLLTFGWLTLGATCIPLIDQQRNNTTATAIDLGVTIAAPTQAGTVGQGAVVEIRWRVLNDTGQTATASLWVESRVDLTTTTLASDIPVEGTTPIVTPWDTTGFAGGEYVIYAEVHTSSSSTQATGPGRVTIDVPPTFAFTEPTENTTLPDSGAITIGWTGSDPENAGRASLALDEDTSHDSGNEVFIHDITLGTDTTTGTFSWTGTDSSNTAVQAGTYNLFATVGDDVNGERFVESGVQLTVPEPNSTPEPNTPVALGIVTPDEDTTFLTSDASLAITYSVNEFNDVLIDLKIDTDDNHSNGNEVTILSQKTVTGGTETEDFDWTGTDANGNAVPIGIYKLFIVESTGSGTPKTAEGKGLIFRRSVENEPLVALLEPATTTTLVWGEYLAIKWRDDDPNATATIRLTYGTDASPGGGAETTILSDRPASTGGDLLNTFAWQLPGSVEPGTYYIFAYIVVDGADISNSVAPGRFIIKNPAGP